MIIKEIDHMIDTEAVSKEIEPNSIDRFNAGIWYREKIVERRLK